MNDRISTPIRKAASYLNYFTLTFILLLTFQPFLKLSAQEEDESPADPAAIQALVRKTQSSNIPRTWEPLIPLVNNSQCANSDFSLGNYTNWSGCFGTWCNNINQNQTRCTTGLYVPFKDPCTNIASTWANNPTGGHFSIETPGTDPCISGLQKVFPGEPFSARLGNQTCSSGGGGYCDKLTYQITYDPANSFFIYRCAVVLEDPNGNGHDTPDRKPRFLFEIRDQASGALVDPVCGVYDLTPGDGITVWQNGPGDYLYKDWNTIGIDFNALTGLVPGQILDIVFTVHGCAMTAHTAYAYISCFCGSMSIANTGCNGSGSVTMTGPPGFTTYEWQGPYCPTCPPSPPTYFGNPITITAAQGAVTGNTFNLTLTALNGCQVVNVQQIIAFTTINAGFRDSLGCAQRSSFFFDTSTVSQNAVTAWQWDFGDPASGPSNTSTLKNPIHAFTAAGTYNVRLISFSTEGCPDTIIRQVAIGDLVVITSPNHRSEICSGQHANIPLAANFADALYTWTATASSGNITGFSNNAVPAPSPIDQILVNTGSQIDSVTYIIIPHESSCIGDPYIFRVVVFPKPNVIFTPPAPSICANQTTNILLTSSNTGSSYTWTANGTLNVTGYLPGSGNVIAQTLNQPGFGLETVWYHVVPTANGCLGDTATVTVHVNPRPHLMTNPMNQTICSKTSTNIVLIASCPGTTYDWTSAVITGNITGNTNGSGSPIVQLLTNNLNTQGSVEYTIHPASGSCVGNDTIFTVFVNPKPTVTTSPLNTSICSNATTNINLTSNVANPTFTWIATGSSGNVSGYSGGSGLTTISQTLVNSGVVAETVTYHIIATASGCSSDSAYFVVTVHPHPIPSIAGSAAVCMNSTTIYSTTAGMSGYTWNVPTGGTIIGPSNTNTISVNWTSMGAQTVTVNYTDPFGCTATTPSVFNVVVTSNPTPTLSPSNDICVGTTVTYSSDPLNTAYVWTVSAGGTITGGGGPANNTVTVHWIVAGPQTISVNYQAGPGCTAPVPTVKNIIVHSLPTASISGTISVCKNSASPLITFTGGTTVAPYTFTYKINGGPDLFVTTVAGNSVTVPAPTNATGIFSYTLVSVQDGSTTTCSQAQAGSVIVTVNALPTATISGTITVCKNSAAPLITFTGASTTAPYTFTYNINGGANQVVTTIVGNSVTVPAPTNVVGPFTYNLISVQDGSATTCSQAQAGSALVTVNELPTASIAGTIAVCKNSASPLITFTGGTTVSPYTFTYKINGGPNLFVTTVAGNSVTVAAPTNIAGTFNYSLVSIQDGSPTSCSQAQVGSAVVTVNPLPTAIITGTTSVCQNAASPLITFIGASATAPYTFTYNINGGANQVVTTIAGNSVTIAAPTTLVGVFTYNLVSVQDGSGTACIQAQAGSAIVTVNSLPTATISGTIDVCKNAASPLITFTGASASAPYTFTYNINGGPNLFVTTVAGNSITVAAPTNVVAIFSYNLLSVHDGSPTACSQIQFGNAVVTVHALPTATVAGTVTVCKNSASPLITFTGATTSAPYTFTYNINGGPNQVVTTVVGNSVTVPAPTTIVGTFSYNLVSVQDGSANTCSQLQAGSAIVTVNPLPTATITGTIAVCKNSASPLITFTGASATAPYTFTYNINGGPNQFVTTVAGNSVTVAALTGVVGVYTYNLLSVQDGSGTACVQAQGGSALVTVNDLPTASISGTIAVCQSSAPPLITFTGANTSSPYTFTYKINGGPNLVVTTIAGNSVTVPAPTGVVGAFTYSLVSVQDGSPTTCFQAQAGSAMVTINPLPTATISGTTAVCQNAASPLITFTGASSPAPYTFTYNINGGANLNVTTVAGNSVTVAAPTGVVGVYTYNLVSVQDGSTTTCSQPQAGSVVVTVNLLPIPTVSGAAAVCLNTSSVYTTESGMTAYSWTVSAGGTITAGGTTSAITVNWSTTGLKTITVNYFNGTNCTAAIATTYNVMVNLLPVPPLNGFITTCVNTTVNYTTDPGMSNYIWTVSAGGSITGGGGTGDSFADVLWNASGPQTISVNYNMSTGCSATIPTVLNVAIKPRPAITNASGMTICSNGTTSFTFASTFIGTTYTWTASGSSGNVSGYSNGAGAGIFQTLVNAGFNIEVVTYTVTPNLNGCDGPTANFTVNVNPVADVYFTPNGQSFCTGGTSNITINSHVAGASFTWTATGSSFNVSGYSPGSGSLIAQTLVNSGPWFENVDYHVFPVANSCAGTDNHVIVNLNPTPQVSFDIMCNDIITTTDAKPFTLKGGTPLGGTYTGPGVTAGIFYPSLAGPGLKTINYSYANTWGCNANLFQNISVVNGIPFPCDNILTDMRDNKQYPTIKIGTQCWMASNLDIGTPIGSIAMQRDNCVLEKYCFGDNAVNCTSMGGLYQWDEMMRFEDTPALQGICPPAWHIPTENDWATLFSFYISNGFAGSPLKWDGYSGFNAFLHGTRFDNANYFFTGFSIFIWSSTSDGSNKAWAHAMNTFNPSVSNYPGNRSNAFSVRCIKD